MTTLDAGAVEVVVIEYCRLNGPDHRTLGNLEPGDHVITHESYVPFLLKAGLICMPHELEALDAEEAKNALDELDAELARMQAEADAETRELEAVPLNQIIPEHEFEASAAFEAEGVVVTADAANEAPKPAGRKRK